MIDLRLGDCLDIMKEIPDKSVDMVLTDPPYGKNYQSSWSKEKRFDVLQGDGKPFIWFLYDAFRVLKDNSSLICFSDWQNSQTFKVAIEAAGFQIKSHVIWSRLHHGMGDLKSSFGPMHDVAWFAVKGKFKFPDKRPKDVISHKREGAHEINHPTQKPVPLCEDLIECCSKESDTILDPFMGSGSTGVACKNLNRKFIGIETEPKYFEIAKERINGKHQKRAASDS